jgi:hypothetical protein
MNTRVTIKLALLMLTLAAIALSLGGDPWGPW